VIIHPLAEEIGDIEGWVKWAGVFKVEKVKSGELVIVEYQDIGEI
jgi:hypothetical protein